MIISQPDRALLIAQIMQFGPRLTGDLLDVGSGRRRRYQNLCPNVRSYKTMDHDPVGEPDIIGSAENIPMPDATFDSVLCTQVLEHVKHPVPAVQEMFRILKPGGRCLLTIPQMSELHEIPNDFFRYTCFGLRVLFEDAGFNVEVIDQRGKYHAMMMHLRIRRLVDSLKPYERRWAMLFLAPLTKILTDWSIWRDGRSRSEAESWHAIGWCILAVKP